MKEKIDSDLIRKYVGGHYTFQDLKKIAREFQSDNDQDDLRSAMHSNWEEFEYKDSTKKDLSSVYNKLKGRIQKDRRPIKLKEKALGIYFRVAAVLLLPLIIYSSITIYETKIDSVQKSIWVEIVSPYGARTHFDLPDGTKVCLNSGTHLKYLSDFQKNREVAIDGEAYFDVHHDASSPFVVQTDEMDVKVVGTKFSITSIAQENLVDVILEEGKVQLTGKGNSFCTLLNPNESFIYDKAAKAGKIIPADAQSLTSWKDGLLAFRGEALGNVLTRIGRWYNVKFEIVDHEVEAFRYRATFQDEPLEEVLRLISLTAPITYEIKERKMNNNDLYENKVVVVKLKQ